MGKKCRSAWKSMKISMIAGFKQAEIIFPDRDCKERGLMWRSGTVGWFRS